MSQRETYRALCKPHYLPIFFQPLWLDEAANGWDVAMVFEGEKLLAVWLYVLEKKWGVKIIRNPQLTPYLGPFFLEKIADENAVFEKLWKQLPKWDVFSVHCFPEMNIRDFLSKKGFVCRERTTFIISLEQTEEALFKKIKDSRRSLIRQAEKALSISENECVPEVFLKMLQDTFYRKNKKLPYPHSFLKKLLNKTLKAKQGNLFTATDENVQAAIFTPFDPQKMYLLLSAFSKLNAHPGAVSLLIWEAIKTAKEMGLVQFDFEGSMEPGIATFFRSFGGEKQTYADCFCNRSLLWKWKMKWLG